MYMSYHVNIYIYIYTMFGQTKSGTVFLYNMFGQTAYGTGSEHTVDGRNPAPPKKPWNDDSLVNANKQWFPMASKWCRILSTHSIIFCVPPLLVGQEVGGWLNPGL